MRAFLVLFRDLGYKRVVAILDGDKAEDAKNLESEFTNYKIVTLIEDDIRDKNARQMQTKTGITDEKGKIKEAYKDYMVNLINEINAAL